MKTLKILQSTLLTTVGLALAIPALFLLSQIKEAFFAGDYYYFLMESSKLACGILYLLGAHYVWFGSKKSLYTLFTASFALIATFAAYLLMLVIGKEAYHAQLFTEIVTRLAFPVLMIELGIYAEKHAAFFYKLGHI